MLRNQQMDTAARIFDDLYMVRVPDLQTRSNDHIKIFGMPVTGNGQIDRELSNQKITVMLPIARLAEMYEEGIPISVIKYDDTKKIFESVQSHLLAWKTILTHGINIGDAPVDDLIILDRFAHGVYEHARTIVDPSALQSFFLKHLGKNSRINPGMFMSPHPGSETLVNGNGDLINITGVDMKEQPERESLSDVFKTCKLGMRSWKS